MSETSEKKENRNCAKCGKPVIKNDSGVIAHIGGGIVEQRCNNCGWTGGQYGGFTQCVRCGDSTSLVNDHYAS